MKPNEMDNEELERTDDEAREEREASSEELDLDDYDRQLAIDAD
jgi:hypothetical protein